MISVKTIATGSKGNAYLLQSGDRWLLLECGIPFKKLQKALDHQVSRLDGCLLSHAHKDHACCIRDLAGRGIDIYAHEETFEWSAMSLRGTNCISVSGGIPFQIANHWLVLPFEGRHDIPCLGYQVSDGEDTLVFATDTGYCRYTFPGMTILMIEANFSEKILWENCDKGHIDRKRANRVFANHMSIERVVEMLKANDLSKLREVRLLHLSDSNSNEALFKRMIQEVAGVPVIVEG